MARQSTWASYVVWGSIAAGAVLASAVTIALVVGNHRGIQIAAPAGMKFFSPQAEEPAALAAVPLPANEMPAISISQAKDLEIGRLKDALHTLAAERDRLDERVMKLEQSLGDITASIRERPSAPPASAVKAAERAVNGDGGGPRTEAAKTAHRIAAAPSQPIAPDVIRHGIPPAGAIASTGGGEAFLAYVTGKPLVAAPMAAQEPMQIHAIPLTRDNPGAIPATGSATTRTEFALDLGTEPNMEALRGRWNSLRNAHGSVLGNLRPLVTVREGMRSGGVELRLIAGPLGNANDATRLCASLQTKGVPCRTAVFDGQRLALN